MLRVGPPGPKGHGINEKPHGFISIRPPLFRDRMAQSPMPVLRYPGLPQVLSSLRLVIHEIGEVDLGPQWHYEKITSPFHRLYFVAGGDGRVTWGGGAAELRPGSIWFFPAGLTADYTCRSRVRKGYLSFNVEWLPGFDLFTGVKAPHLLGKWRGGSGVWPWPGRPGERGFATALTAGCWEVLSKLPHPSPARDLPHGESADGLAGVLSYLEENLSARLTVAQLAQRHGSRPSVFAKVFLHILGKSPKTFLMERLFSRAATGLLAEDLPVKALASRLGFEDEFYFSRWFRKIAGASPTAYRQRGMAPQEKNQ